MGYHLILRIHSDVRLGLGHVSRALAVARPWEGLGGAVTIAISGDERAKAVGEGNNPFSDKGLGVYAVYLGEALDAPLPDGLKPKGAVALVDLWDATPDIISACRPMKVALMEDDGDAHEGADLLFQPYLEGLKWPGNPIRTENGRKLRPYEEVRGSCRVLKGSGYIVLSSRAAQLRPRREPEQPLNVKKLLVTFGGTDGPGLAPRAYEAMAKIIAENGWAGSCTLLAPSGVEGFATQMSGLTVKHSIQDLTGHLPEYDAVWCSGGVTLAECLCLGIPAAVWSQNERQKMMVADIALEGACINLGMGTDADLSVVQEALADWLGPLGQETRQEQSANGMALIDGSGAARVAQELMGLAGGR
jgi:spore coat polysaccharide biosynthesis predicted glycosyltransferase SpsG